MPAPSVKGTVEKKHWEKDKKKEVLLYLLSLMSAILVTLYFLSL